MTELVNVKIENKDGVLLVSSRDIAEQLGKEHRNILKDIREKSLLKYEQWIIPHKYKANNGQEYDEYLLTKDGFIMLVFNYNGYNDFKEAYINKFNEMEKALQEQKTPQTYLEALKALVASEEEKERLRLENKEMQPKAKYFDNLVDRKLLTNFRDTAKELKIKEREFIKWLEEEKFIYRDSKNKIKPFAEFITGEKKYFEIKEWGNGASAGTQTLITPRGKETFKLLHEMK